MELPKWHERPESSDKKIKDQTILDGKNFLKLADHFITFANTKNKTIKETGRALIKVVTHYLMARTTMF